jgi:hypothetical protein
VQQLITSHNRICLLKGLCEACLNCGFAETLIEAVLILRIEPHDGIEMISSAISVFICNFSLSHTAHARDHERNQVD